MRALAVAALLVFVHGLARADEPPPAMPPGMVEVPTAPPPAPAATPPLPSWMSRWWSRPGRRPIGFAASTGFSCVAASRTAEGDGGCFALARIGFEFGWGELHAGALIGRPTGYDPFSGRDEGPGPADGLQIGIDAGSPYMTLSRRVKLAIRGSFDHDLFWSADGSNFFYTIAFVSNAAFAVSLARGVAFTARAGLGLALPYNLVVDGGIGLLVAR